MSSTAEQIETLKGLLERVKAADKADRRLDTHLHWFLVHGVKPYAGMSPSPDIHTYTLSVDAALWLVGHIMPSWWVQLRTGSDFRAEVWCERSGWMSDIQYGENEALAILAALLSAKLALLTQEKPDGP